MSNSFFDRYVELCKTTGETPNSVAKIIGASSGSVTAWKNGTEPRYSTVLKIAEHFSVSVDYLLGKENKKAPTVSDERQVNHEDIKFALFGGDGEITDAMYEEVRNFAEFVKQREAEKRKG